jgi:hypothetical protein
MKEIAYKYLEDEYLHSLLKGEIYLNSFSNIRRLEKAKMDALIGDNNEGLVLNKTNCLYIGPESPNNERLRKDLREARGSNVGKGSTLISVNGTYTTHFNDAWMFCTSRERQDKYWQNKSNYNNCVKILDALEFFERCAIELEKEYKMRSSWGDCKYEEIWGVIENGTVKKTSYYRKAKLFKPQKERRFVFEPFMGNASLYIHPKVIKIKVSDLFEVLY